MRRARSPRIEKKPPSIGDVAKRAGVSTATVSRFLSTPDLVRPQKRETIKSAIDELGYIPHGAARALASRRTNTIGAIVPTLDNAIFAKGIQSLQKRLQAEGYTLLVASSGYSLDEELTQAEILIARGVDAMFLVGLDHNELLSKRLEQSDIPYINTWAFDPATTKSCIGFDNYAAARQVTEYLITLGHRQFGVVSGVTAHNDRATNRLRGIRDALTQAGIELTDQQVVECPYLLDDGRLAARTLLGQDKRPTAVICGNDVLAYGVLHEIEETGLSIPGDVSVVGFDDLPMSQFFKPALTTVRVPSEEMGDMAAEYLISRIKGHEPKDRIELPVSLAVRSSTSSPKI